MPCVLGLLGCAPAVASTLASWTQYAQRGVAEARLVTDGGPCPTIAVDGRARPMATRAEPSAEFPVRLCAATLPVGVRGANADGREFAVPAARPRHLVIIGDTGCRLKGPKIQDCHDPNAWPFQRVARNAAREHPDLVIHVGDYVYRESACPADDRRCAGTPWGDNWATWNADFFSPGAALLHRSVWLMARGNHEDCHRAGFGWSTLLGHEPANGTCHAHEGPLVLDLAGVRLALLDDNDAADDADKADPAVIGLLARDIDTAISEHADWLVTHHPFRGVSKPDRRNDGRTMEGANATLLAALGERDETPLQLMVSGHIHDFQIVNVGAATPQLIVGDGGDDLDTVVPPRLTGLVTGGAEVTLGLALARFGYVVMDRRGATHDWRIAVHATDGATLRRCELRSRRLTCAEPDRRRRQDTTGNRP